jgi:hypothetical protein
MIAVTHLPAGRVMPGHPEVADPKPLGPVEPPGDRPSA